jgi:hypothetical protein
VGDPINPSTPRSPSDIRFQPLLDEDGDQRPLLLGPSTQRIIDREHTVD